MIDALSVSAAFYLVPKILRYLTTDPSDRRGGNLRIISRFREEAATYTRILMNNVGRGNWYYATEVIFDNLWIVHLSISCIIRSNPVSTNIELGIYLGLTYMILALVVWLVRHTLSRMLENVSGLLSRFIAPINLRENVSDPDQESTSSIPERFHDDPVLVGYGICPITQEPTDRHVSDPTTGHLVTYSLAAARRWLRATGTSPVTRLPLDDSQLRPRPILNILVRLRVKWLKRREKTACRALNVIRSWLDGQRPGLSPKSAEQSLYSEEDKKWCQEKALKLEQLIENWEQSEGKISEELHEIIGQLRCVDNSEDVICAMSGKPIRHVMTLLNSDLEEMPIMYFERFVVQEWISNTPNLAPQGWPQQHFPLPIISDHFQDCSTIQRLIDKNLMRYAKIAIKEAKGELRNLRSAH